MNATQVAQLSEFLDQLPIQQYVSLTHAKPTSRAKADFLLNSWLDLLERHHRESIGAIVCTEGRPPGPHIHHHLLLVCRQTLDVVVERDAWESLSCARSTHSIQIERYDPTRGALSYVLKTYTTDDDEIRLLNLEYFFELPSSFWSATAYRRRQYRRHIQHPAF